MTGDELEGYTVGSVWGTSANDVYAAGDEDLIRHFDGRAWTELQGTRRPGHYLNAMWGSLGTDVFVAGANGDMFHHGTSPGFAHMNSGTNAHVWGIWGFSSQEVHAVDFDGNLLRYDGSYWSVEAREPGNAFFAIWGTSGKDLYVTTSDMRILHYDGSGFTDLNRRSANMLFSIWGASASDVFFAGEGGTGMRWRP
jgi:hypothetical protein